MIEPGSSGPGELAEKAIELCIDSPAIELVLRAEPLAERAVAQSETHGELANRDGLVAMVGEGSNHVSEELVVAAKLGSSSRGHGLSPLVPTASCGAARAHCIVRRLPSKDGVARPEETHGADGPTGHHLGGP